MPTSTREYYAKWAMLQWLIFSILLFKHNEIDILSFNFLLFILFGFFIVSSAISIILCLVVGIYISKINDPNSIEEFSMHSFAKTHHFRKILVVVEFFIVYFIARFSIRLFT